MQLLCCNTTISLNAGGYQKGDIKQAYITTSINTADKMTKSLTPHNHFPHFHRLLVFLPISGDPDIDKVQRFFIT